VRREANSSYNEATALSMRPRYEAMSGFSVVAMAGSS
jgi:hypothetical protein